MFYAKYENLKNKCIFHIYIYLVTPALRGYCRMKATPITKYIGQKDLRRQNNSYRTKRGDVKINGNTYAKAPFIFDKSKRIAELKHTREENKPSV